MEIPSFSTRFNDDIIISAFNNKEKGVLSMSSIILEYTPTHAIIASDSRCVFNDGSYFDYYPKIFKKDEALIAIAGVNNLILNKQLKEIGKLIYLYDGENSSILSRICDIQSKQLPKNKRTDIVLIEIKNKITVSVFSAMYNATSSYIYTQEHDRFILGVNHCRNTDKESEFNSYSEPDLDRIKRLIKIDRQSDEMVRNISTVGGPIQAYDISLCEIKDLSDDDAPRDFSKYYKWKNL